MVESEGNGRMCLTLPETLITVMGIEKVVPSWRDLEVFLQLLPRSSTGERMNPYTSAWTGVHPSDGPQAFHLVLLDNGRTAVLADEVGREALHCIKCSACMNVCPVYERTGGHAYGSVYPGPIGAVLSPQLTGVEDNASLPYASSLCGACFDACPVRIDIPSLLVHLRGKHVEERRAASRIPTAEAVAMAAASWVMSDPKRFAAAEKASRAGRLLARRGRLSSLPPPLSAWTSVAGRAGAAGRDVPRVVGPDPRAVVVTARDEVLARVRAARAGAALVEPARDYRQDGEHAPGSAAVLDLLEDRLVDYKAAVRRSDTARLRHAVAEALARVPACADGPVLLPPDLPAAWAPDGRADDGSLPAYELDGFAAVVTGGAGRLRRDGDHRARRRTRPGSAHDHPGARRARLRRPRRPGGAQRARDAFPAGPDPADDLHQRPVRDQRHRAGPGRGRTRAADVVSRAGHRLRPTGWAGSVGAGGARTTRPARE